MTIVRVPAAGPAAVGVNVTSMVVDSPGGTDRPMAPLAANGPVVSNDTSVSISVLGLVIRTVWAALVVDTRAEPKSIAPGNTATSGAVPRPDVGIVRTGSKGSSDEIEIEPKNGPVANATNVTSTVTLSPGSTKLCGGTAIANGGVAVIEPSESTSLPKFEIVRLWNPSVPSRCGPKSSDGGKVAMWGATPTPNSMVGSGSSPAKKVSWVESGPSKPGVNVTGTSTNPPGGRTIGRLGTPIPNVIDSSRSESMVAGNSPSFWR